MQCCILGWVGWGLSMFHLQICGKFRYEYGQISTESGMRAMGRLWPEITSKRDC